MSRGAEQQVQTQATDAQRQAQAQAAQTQQGMSTLANGSLIPGYTSMASGKGPYADAVTQHSMEGINSAYDAASQNATNRVAQTNNSAGYGELQDKLAMDRGQQVASTAANNTIQEQQAGLAGLSGLYGMDANTLRAQLGLGPSYLGIAQNAASGQKNQVQLGPFGTYGAG